MRKLILGLVLLISSVCTAQQQRIEILFDDFCFRVIDLEGYNFPRAFPIENRIIIEDSTTFKFIQDRIHNMEKVGDDHKMLMNVSLQIILVDSSSYDVVNSSRSLKLYSHDYACMELNGKGVKYDRALKEVIDEILYYFVKNNGINDKIAKGIVNGKRYPYKRVPGGLYPPDINKKK